MTDQIAQRGAEAHMLPVGCGLLRLEPALLVHLRWDTHHLYFSRRVQAIIGRWGVRVWLISVFMLSQLRCVHESIKKRRYYFVVELHDCRVFDGAPLGVLAPIKEAIAG